MSGAPIAIVGRGCVLPGALDPAELWRLVLAGESAIGQVPSGRWRVPAERVLTRHPKDAADRTWSDRGGYVRGFDARFDPNGFAIEASEITALDPIARWSLHASREALREAGIEGARERAGVVLGNLSFPTAAHALMVERHWFDDEVAGARASGRLARAPIDPRERFHSSLPASLTARALGLRGGPAFCLDAACASSLYAIALACDALRDRRADVMLAGAVNCTDDLFIHVGFCALDALSKSGRSRPFHADADGLVPAEGAAVVALMRLDDALAEGRRVLGVIRGVGLANDGRAKSFLAPSEDGQVRAMRAAYRASGLSPRAIGWLECHATGTQVGDAAEVRSTARVFEGCDELAIGSLKANLGHLITTAGAAGLLKVLAAMEAGVRPPTPHFERASAALDGTPLRVVTAPEPWEQDVRRAAISAFGFGGNDAHLIVEQWPPIARGRAGHRPAAASGSRPGPEAGSDDGVSARAPLPLEAGGREPIAIVAIGARVGPYASARAFADALSTGAGGRRMDEVVLPLESLRTPPADLEPALGQQTALLAAALDARIDGLDPERTGVVIGMQCDTEVARYGLRWRAERESFAPRLTAAGVLGTMPNIPANRLNRELDLRGPSYTVSADELSGVHALSIAARALREGELDAALVGAVDLACAPVHEAAARALLPGSLHRGGDAAVVLVLERLTDARSKGRAVLAILDEDAASADDLVLGPRVEGGSLAPRFGHAHAASGLVHVAAAALALHRRARLGESPGAWSSDRERRARVEVEAIFGERAVVTLREDVETPDGAVALTGPEVKHPLVLRAHPPAPRMTTAREDAEQLAPAPALPLARHEPLELQWSGELVMTPPDAPRPEHTNGHARARSHTNGRDLSSRPAGAAGPQSEKNARGLPAGGAGPQSEKNARGLPSRPAGGAGGGLAEASPRAARHPLIDAIEARQREVAALHADFLRTQTELHERFLSTRAAALAALAGADPRPNARDFVGEDETRRAGEGARRAGATQARRTPRVSSSPLLPVSRSHEPPARPFAELGVDSRGSGTPSAPTSTVDAQREPDRSRHERALPARSGGEQATPSIASATPRGLKPATPPPPTGRTFSRRELEVHASGRISELFGPLFAPQDRHAVQVRMPEPPLLLADRVTGLTGEPGTMKTGTVWTETDVRADSWYVHHGRMPPGLMIESGQADLFLISWLGADLLNRGERSYRLLGCKLTWHRSPPAIGETLAYDIHVDGHARQGDVRLFFFHYDCQIDGQPALTVRSGQAGFFTDAELAASAGILWTPDDHEVADGARLDPPRVRCQRTRFDEEALEALAQGDLSRCFGAGYEQTRAHVRTPSIAGGDMRFLEEVTDFDPRGGPRGRGYLRAIKRIAPDDWYFRGHFKNDPCMPGTLMFEGCLSAMAFYLIGLGHSLDCDGWRFEPIPDETYTMICRGQVLPTSKELVYEIFVEEVHDGPFPRLYADLLCTVDGLKAFHAGRVGLQLVPDWPLERTLSPRRDREGSARAARSPSRSREGLGEGSEEGVDERSRERPVAELDGVRLDERAMLASAWGRPSLAFGPRYAEFDGVRRAPRLPGPPYHMVSRVVALDGAWDKRPGASVEIEYDVPPDAWYFADGGSGAMPYALLLEAALQPCGWLASAIGCALGRPEDLRFRNLDGEGEVLAEVPPDAGTLRTRATLTSITDTAAMILVAFDVVSALGDVDVMRLKTVFGFFPDAAFRDQAGLPIDDAQRALFEAPGEPVVLDSPALFAGDAPLPSGRLSLLDEVSFFDPAGGEAGLGAARASSRIDPGAWFFRAHFFQDPVQPGSLGIEAMLTLLRYTMRELGLHEGLRAPRFTPIAGEQRWKYRGQVRPSDREITVTLELTSIERGSERVRALADASFWVDGKRIYEASVGAELVERDAPAEASVERGARSSGPRIDEASDDRARVPEGAAIARYWRSQLGVGPNPAEDLYVALVRRFVGEVRVEDACESLQGRPALYVANHQTAIETLMLSVVLGARFGVPLITLAKTEHRESWLGRLLAWIFAQPGVTEPELTAYFDRDDRESLPALLRAQPRDRSLLVHVEGTRARSCREPIARISGVPIELAIERGYPIVPVRVAGGLPVAPVLRRLDFPLAMCAQDLRVGAPIHADELASLDYKARTERVRAAIEALAPADETPNLGDLAFATRVAQHMERTRVDLPHAVLACALLQAEHPCALTERMKRGDLDPHDPEHRWAADLAHRLTLGV